MHIKLRKDSKNRANIRSGRQWGSGRLWLDIQWSTSSQKDIVAHPRKKVENQILRVSKDF